MANLTGEENLPVPSNTTSSGEATEVSPLLAKDVSTSPGYLGNTSTTQFWLIFSQVLILQFIFFFDSTILSSSHPAITSYFGVAHAASWLSTSFLIASTAFQPLFGRLTDTVGRKPLFVGCTGIFALSTAWCAMATSFWSFVAARAACGLGAGGVLVLGQIITSDLVPIERRGSYQACCNIIYGLGSSSGAALGGALAESLGWRWEFGIQVPLLLSCMVVSLTVMPVDLGLRKENARRNVWTAIQEFDIGGSCLIVICITSLILALNLGGNILPWSHPLISMSFSLFFVSMFVTLWVELRAKNPTVPLRLCSSRPHANIIFANFISAMLTQAMLFNMPLYFQAVLLTSGTSSGLRLVPSSIASCITAAITGITITRTRRVKWAIYLGVTFYLIGMFTLSQLQRNMASIVYLFVLIPSAMGEGFQFPASMISLLAVSAHCERAVVTTTLMLWRSLGMVLGVGLSSLVVQNALLYYLDKFVQGDEKDYVVSIARSSVEAIVNLDAPYQEQVVQSYEAAIHIMFMGCGALAILSLVIVLSLRSVRISLQPRLEGSN